MDSATADPGPVSRLRKDRAVLEGGPPGSRQLMLAFVGGALVAVATDARATEPIGYLLGLVVTIALAAAVVVVPQRFILLPLALLSLCSPDITQGNAEIATVGVVPSATIWHWQPLGFPPAFTVFALLVVATWRLPPAPVRRHEAVLLGYLFLIVPLVSFFGGYATSQVTAFVSDAKLAMFFGVGLVCFRRYFHAYPAEVARMVALVLACAAGRYAVDLAYLLLNVSRTVIGTVNRVSVDSVKGGLVVVILFLIHRVAYQRRVWAAVLLPFGLLLLVAYATRWLILMLAIGMVVFAVAAGARRAVVGGMAVGALLVTGLFVALWLRPASVEVMQSRFAFGDALRAEGIQGLDFTRVISIANTVHLLRERKAVVQGLGYGSWYSDAYLPFPVAGDLASGFETESIEQRRFYRVHDFVFHMLLKVGLAGLVLYLAAFWRPLRTAWIKRRALRHDWRWTVSMVSWSAAPVIITSMYWSGKGLLLCALFAATADAIARTLEGSRERESLT